MVSQRSTAERNELDKHDWIRQKCTYCGQRPRRNKQKSRVRLFDGEPELSPNQGFDLPRARSCPADQHSSARSLYFKAERHQHLHFLDSDQPKPKLTKARSIFPVSQPCFRTSSETANSSKQV